MSRFAKTFGLAAAVLGLVAGASSRATAQFVLTATASGSTAPDLVNSPGTTTNGDFTITGEDRSSISPAPRKVGDGWNETTTWNFDFTRDPDYPDFDVNQPLASAKLTLALDSETGFDNDQFAITGLKLITGQFSGQPAGTHFEPTIELLNSYSSSAILAKLAATGGLLPMTYQDDATVSFARLELRFQSATHASAAVPEPASIAMAGTGAIVGLGVARRRRRRAA